MTQIPSKNKPLYVIAIDIGSSSIRAALYDSKARMVEGTTVRAGHPLHSTPDGGAEEFAEHLTENVEGVLDELLGRNGGASEYIAGVGVDSMASTVLGVDENGKALTPIYTYADTRSRKSVDDLRNELDVSSVFQRTGTPQHTSYLPSRLRWLQETRPEVFERVHRWMDAGTFLYTRWFGNLDMPTSYSMASWTGLLNRHRLEWDDELLSHLSMKASSFQPLAAYSTLQNGLAESFSERWPTLRNVPFFLAVGDGVAANIGSGCVSPNRVALTVGTSGAIRVLLNREIDYIPPGLWAYRLGEERTLLGGAFSDGGSVFAWMNGLLNLPPRDELEMRLKSLPPDGHGLTMLPFLSGERSPGWAASAFGTVHGLTMSTTPIEILQAGLESVAYRFSLVHELLEDFVDDEYDVIASGGAIINSPYWMQMMADVLQHPVTASTEDEATSRGTAILALHALGVWSTLEDIPAGLGTTYRVNPERGIVYQNGLERQHRLYDLVIGHDAEIQQRLSRTTME